MTTDQIVLELRALPGAPDALRERVRALPQPRVRREWQFPALNVRRTLFVAAPAAVALALGAAAMHGVLSSGGQRIEKAAAPAQVNHGGSVHRALRGEASGSAATTTTPSFGAVTGQHAMTQLTPLTPLTPRAIPPSTTRLNRYQAWLRVQVERDKLSSSATQAMRIARGYGGYVASVDLNTPGQRGRASLLLRVPVMKVQQAVLRLETLGAVTAQHVRIQDLQRQYDTQQRQIEKLRIFIAGLRARLASPSLPADERLRLQYQLEQATHSLTVKTRAHEKTQREGTLATISVAFSVKHAAAAAPHHRGRLGRTLGDAGHFLIAELAWLLYALIVVAPIAALVALVVFGVRAARRGSDRRLLEGA